MALEKQRPGAEARPVDLSTFGGVGSENTRKQGGTQRQKPDVVLAIVHDDEGERSVPVKGRVLWMLRRLIEAGPEGFTAADAPAGTRVAHFIFRLRQDGISVETEYEGHGGEFSGRHARYRLACKVTLREPSFTLRGGA